SFAARADDGADPGNPPNRYVVTNLTSDLANNTAPNIDAVLQNAWGVAFSPGASPFWIADNATGCSTLYDGAGIPQPLANPLQVKIPLPGGTIPATACKHNDPKNPSNPTPATPTGLVWNPTTTFLVPGTTTPASFIFSTEDGTISAWANGLSPAGQAFLAANNMTQRMRSIMVWCSAPTFTVSSCLPQTSGPEKSTRSPQVVLLGSGPHLLRRSKATSPIRISRRVCSLRDPEHQWRSLRDLCQAGF